MSEVTVSKIKEVRDRTQAGMSDCKKALEEAGGDIDKAVEIVLKKGIVKAAARAGRIATEGEVCALVSPDKQTGVLVEINCQTDFVARGDAFQSFKAGVLTLIAGASQGADVSKMLFPGASYTLTEIREQLVAKTGENVVVRRSTKLESKAPGEVVHAYVHLGGKLGVLLHAQAPVEASTTEAFVEFLEDTAMQIAAMSPLVVSRQEVDPVLLQKQQEIFAAQLKEEGKPEQAWPKILEGKTAKWFSEVALLDQESVVHPGSTLEQLRQALGRTLGGEVLLHGFARYALGDGIAKEEDTWASEIQSLL